MQNRSFQAYPITLYSNLAQYKVNWNPTTGMWELRSAQGRRLNTARDIFVLAKQIQNKDTLIIPKETEYVNWLPDSVFNEIQEYSLLLQTYKLIGATDFSHIKPPKRFTEIYNLSREQLITLGFKAQPTAISHPTWWFTAALGSSWIAFYLYAEKPFT
jgi:hypothetical protein